jgi:rhodanese-related sulfurtransferase
MNIKSCRRLMILAFMTVISSTLSYAQNAAPAVEMISADELKAKVTNNQPVTIIDVRSSEGYAAATTTVKGAIHFKLRKLKYRLAYPPMKNVPKDQEIVTYCACPKDEASIAAAQILQASGFKRVKVLQGGWLEWLRVNGPVEPRAKTD